MYSYQQKPARKVIQRCNIAANRALGQAAEQRAANQLLSEGWKIYDFHVCVRPNTATGAPEDYYFYPDFLCETPSNHLCLVEVKSSMTAPLTSKQASGYPAVKNYGGTIINSQDPNMVNIPAGTPTYEMRGD